VKALESNTSTVKKERKKEKCRDYNSKGKVFAIT
jgi:hypothetical protein